MCGATPRLFGADGPHRLLELNHNLIRHCGGRMAMTARYAEEDYAETIKMILDAALARMGD